MFKKLSKMKILMDYKSMTEGERKLAFAVEIMNYFVLFIVGVALYFTVCSLFVSHDLMAPKDLLDFIKEMTSTFIWGASAVLTIYSGGNILSYKFGQKGPPPSPPPPGNGGNGDDPPAKPVPKPNNDPSDLIG